MKFATFKFLILLLSFLFTHQMAWAQSDSSWIFSPFTPELRIVDGSDKNHKQESAWGASLELRKNFWGLQAEVLKSNTQSGNQSLNVGVERSELRLLVLLNPTQSTFLGNNQFYLGAGAASYQDKIETRVLGTSDLSTQPWKSAGLLSAKIETALPAFEKQQFIAALDGKMLFASQIQKNPIWILGLKLGILF